MTPKCPDCKRDQDDCVCASPASVPEGLTLDAIYDAWHGAGVDIAGGNWKRFVVLLAAAPTPSSPASAPEGWKLVPFEPTEEMINKVLDERMDALISGKDHTFIDIYKAMLASAPTPPSTEDRKVGTAHATPGASGFTMCVFNATDVPVGTVLYAMQEDKP